MVIKKLLFIMLPAIGSMTLTAQNLDVARSAEPPRQSVVQLVAADSKGVVHDSISLKRVEVRNLSEAASTS